MATIRLPDSAFYLFEKAADERVRKAMGSEYHWFLPKLWHRTYDMGQNINLAFQELHLRKGNKEINWLSLPGHEVCSSLCTSILHEGLQGAGWGRWILDEYQKAINLSGDNLKVRGTQDIDPAVAWLVSEKFKQDEPLFRILKPGDPIRPYSLIQGMSWSEPGESNIAQIFLNLVKSPFAFMSTFSRGIKVYQKQRKRPYPAYHTTHQMLTLPNIAKDKIKYISQEALTFIKHDTQDYFWQNMVGTQPRCFILEPTFIYG